MKRNRLITLIIVSFLLVLFIPINSVAQEAYIRWNTFDIGSIANMFANDGEISQGGCWYQLGRHPAFEYPIGSGNEYGMAIGFYVGARRTADVGGENPEDKPFVDMCLDEYKDNWDDFHWKFIRLAAGSIACLTLFPVQDILGIGTEGRMSIPDKSKGNWTWKLVPGKLTANTMLKLKKIQRFFRK